MPNSEEKIKVEAVKIIARYFGQKIARLYDDFYSTKTSEEILASLRELLVDYLGSAKTEEIIKHLNY